MSGAYQYGQAMGGLHLGIRRMLEDISRGFNDTLAGRPPQPLTLEEREARSIARYRARADAERRAGLAHVAAEGRRVRRELGLEEQP